MTRITVTTGDGPEGREVAASLGVVSGETVVGVTFDDEEMAEGMPWVTLTGTAVETRRR